MAGPIDAIVAVTITATNATPQVANFGTPAILCYHTLNADYIRTYTSLTGLVADGFATTSPAYYMAQAILSQTPTVPSFKVIRGTTAVTQAGTFIVTDRGGATTNTGDSIGFSFMGTDGVVVDYHYTPATAKTPTEVATAIAALTDATGYAATSASATVTITASATKTIGYVSAVRGGVWLDTTPTAVPATDLDAALTVDTDWYGICGEHQDATNIGLVAAWAETNKRLHSYTTADTANLTSSTGIAYTLKGLGDTYSHGMYSGTPVGYSGLALMAQRFTAAPGSDTWAFKQLANVTVDILTANQITALLANRCNYYISVAGVSITQVGICASGLYADLRRGIDALKAQIQIQLYGLLVALPKAPYDPPGIAMMGGEVSSALQQFTATPSAPMALLRGDPGYAPQVLLPLMANTTSTDRGNRLLKNLNFVAYAQNAVQTVQVNGTVNT